jgi:Flp pilus assembly protein TadG
MSFFTALLGRLRRLRENREGNMLLMFGIGAIMLFCATGIGIDMARGYSTRLRLNQALDAAGLAIAALPSTATATQQQTTLLNFFKANYPAGSLGNSSGTITPSVSINGQTITVTATTTVQTLFMQIVPGSSGTMTVSATSVIKKGTGLELALALDNTGSMFATQNGVSNISALQQDTQTLINTLFGQTTNQSQLFISIVPFVTAVNLPPQLATSGVVASVNNPFTASPANFPTYAGTPYLSYDSTQGDDTKWKGCPLENKYPADISETEGIAQAFPGQYLWDVWQVPGPSAQVPQGNTYPADNVLTKPDGTSNVHENFFTANGLTDCNMNAAQNKDCPTQITPLTNDQTTLLNAAAAMQAWCQSGTMIHIGLVWGWRTISPNGIFNNNNSFYNNFPHTPALYHDSNWLKAVVLMTDGQDTEFQGCDETFSYSAASGGTGTLYAPNASTYPVTSGSTQVGQKWNNGCSRPGSTNPGNPPPTSGMTPYGRLGGPNNYIGVGVPDPTNGGTPSTGATNNTNGKPLLDEEVAEACVAIKADGVRLYTIAFTGAAANSIAMLQTCASDPNQTFFNAPTQADLQAAFTTIAQDLNKIRVAQ